MNGDSALQTARPGYAVMECVESRDHRGGGCDRGAVDLDGRLNEGAAFSCASRAALRDSPWDQITAGGGEYGELEEGEGGATEALWASRLRVYSEVGSWRYAGLDAIWPGRHAHYGKPKHKHKGKAKGNHPHGKPKKGPKGNPGGVPLIPIPEAWPFDGGVPIPVPE